MSEGRLLNRLKARSIEGELPRGRHADGGGLILQVSKWGTKAWAFRYLRDGVDHHMGLGPFNALSLKKARERARECRELLALGLDPIDARKTKQKEIRLAAAGEKSFEHCAQEYVTAHEDSWHNPKHRAQWSSTLKSYVYPAIGKTSVADVDTVLVRRCLDPIWRSKPETAKRIRGRIELVLDWAAAQGFRTGDNPARWRGHLDKLLPAPTKVRAVIHHPALPWGELPAFMSKLRKRDEITARALELTILTALRTSEVLNAQWSEFDSERKIWTVPAARMKARREHRVPLSAAALEVIKQLPRKSAYVFPGRRQGALSNMAMLATLERMGRDDITVHGFRSTFRDWAAEATGFANHVVEMALAHVIDDKVEAAYRRGDLFEKRRVLMDAWAVYCKKLPATIHKLSKAV